MCKDAEHHTLRHVMIDRPLSNLIMVPRSAWVCCDDCHEWRRISAILAVSIEST
ncbi:hypothetical protein HanPI659440_Chr15g0584391 [Helianthus annuus]|nr:hypothetical protein HanPI659440_Chr15g0584391 [Helianthus annuus]